ncbi:MAG: DUF4221 domain-containing protein [Bacteroidales bacterium]|nr:DUF4221 domain-containing protein [Bacteroidales bacterium]
MNKRSIIIYIASLIIFILCYSCKTENIKLVKDKDVFFKTECMAICRTSGVYFDSTLNKDLFYCTDILTNKCIKIFDFDCNLVKTIKLDSIPKLDYMCIVQVVSNDTVIMLGNQDGNPYYQDMIYVCDFNGRLKKTVVFPRDYYKSDYKSDYYKKPSIGNNIYYNNKVYLKNIVEDYWYYNKNNMTPETTCIMDSLIMNSAYMAAIDLSDTTTNLIQPLFDSIYRENFEKGYIVEGNSFYHIANNKLFLPIGHNGKVYVVNLDTQKIERTFQLTSKYTGIGFNYKMFVEGKEKSVYPARDFLTHKAGGFVERIIWDKYNKLYYVAISHENKQDVDYNKIETMAASTFSILIYDENFNIKGEEVLPRKYLWYAATILVSPKGLWFQTGKYTDKDYDKNFQKFTLYRINK